MLIIIGVLVTIALPRYETALAKTKWAGVERICGEVANANYIHYQETGKWFSSVEDIKDYMALPTIDGIIWIAYEHTATGESLGWFYGLRTGVLPPRYLGIFVYPNGSKEKATEGGAPYKW